MSPSCSALHSAAEAKGTTHNDNTFTARRQSSHPIPSEPFNYRTPPVTTARPPTAPRHCSWVMLLVLLVLLHTLRLLLLAPRAPVLLSSALSSVMSTIHVCALLLVLGTGACLDMNLSMQSKHNCTGSAACKAVNTTHTHRQWSLWHPVHLLSQPQGSATCTTACRSFAAQCCQAHTCVGSAQQHSHTQGPGGCGPHLHLSQLLLQLCHLAHQLQAVLLPDGRLLQYGLDSGLQGVAGREQLRGQAVSAPSCSELSFQPSKCDTLSMRGGCDTVQTVHGLWGLWRP